MFFCISCHTIECDAIVVGSGCGGAVAAANLARSGFRVIVLEKGNYFVSKDYSSLEGPSMFELFESNGFLMTRDGRFQLMAGSTVGGSSAVNWSASIKTPGPILKEWSVDRQIPTFASEEYEVAMDEVCKRINVTEKLTQEGYQNQILRKGCEKLGLDVKTVPRNYSSWKHDCGSCAFGCRTGDKNSTDRTWLVDAVNYNAVILTRCKAEKLILENNSAEQRRARGRKKKCLGVWASSLSKETKKTLQIHAKVTVLACGSLTTPLLLVSSGLTNPNIGRNLHLHPILMAWGYFPQETSEPVGSAHEGEITTSMHLVQEDSAAPIAALQTPALGPGMFAALMPWVSGSDIKERMAKYARTSQIFALVRDESSGEVKLHDIINYMLVKTDQENLTLAIKRALRILIAAGAEEVGTYRSDGQKFKCKGMKEKDLEEFLRTISVSEGPISMSKHWSRSISVHQMGSCRMGATEKEGAIDGYGENWEAEDLYVCDSSVLPTALGINPMVTIQSTSYWNR